MFPLRITTTAVFVACSHAACAASGLDLAPARADQPWHPRATVEGEITADGTGMVPAGLAGKGYLLPANENLTKQQKVYEADPVKEYSLADLVDIAESEHPDTRATWLAARDAARAVEIAESTYRPQIRFSSLAGHQDSHQQASTAGLQASGGGHGQGVISALSLQWLLFDFGERASVVEAARQATIIASIAFTAAHQKVIESVSVAYYRHGAALARSKAARTSLANSEAILAAAEDRYRQGTGTVIEVAQARAGCASARLALAQANGAERNGYVDLLSAVGISPLSVLRIAPLPVRPLPAKVGAEAEDVIAKAVSRRPDVLAAYSAQRASQAHVQSTQAEFRPKVFASATANYGSGSLGVSAIPGVGQPPTVNISGAHGSTVFIGLTVPIYDGGLRSAALAQARDQTEQAALKLARVQDEAVRQIVVAQNALRTALAAHEATQEMVTAAQTAFDGALVAYRNGIGTATEVNLIQNQLLQAQIANADAYSNALSSASTLALATGSLGTVQSP